MLSAAVKGVEGVESVETKNHVNQSNEDIDKKSDDIYLLPNDVDELVRLRKQHNLLRLICQGNFDAPIYQTLREGITVLDSGCGPGNWILEMSKEYPQSKFVGIDISDSFPSKEDRAANCRFELQNVLKQLPFPENHFGFIHQQYLLFGIPERCWPSVIQGFVRTLKPGGWIELTEPELTDFVNIGPKASIIHDSIRDGAAQKGLRISIARNLESQLINSGLTNIRVKRLLMPLVYIGGELEDLSKANYATMFRHALRPLVVQKHPEYADVEVYDKFVTETMEEAIENETRVALYRISAQKQ